MADGKQFATVQWVTSWYGAGKTSADSRFNIPGKIAWLTMEAPGFCTLLYIMNTLPAETGLASLPLENKIMGSLFVCPIPLPRICKLIRSAGNSLHLPRNHVSLPQPLHGPHPSFRLARRPHIPSLQWHLHWLLARRLRPHHARRMAERSKLQSWRTHDARHYDLGSWFGRKYLA